MSLEILLHTSNKIPVFLGRRPCFRRVGPTTGGAPARRARPHAVERAAIRKLLELYDARRQPMMRRSNDDRAHDVCTYASKSASTASPGPKPRVIHGRRAWACRIRSRMKRTVGDDMLPYSVRME